MPLTAEAFRQYRLGGAHLSAAALAVVKRLIAGEKVTQEESGLSKREWTELMEKLGRSTYVATPPRSSAPGAADRRR